MNINKSNNGDLKLDWLSEFTEEKLFLVDIQDEVDEPYFSHYLFLMNC